MKPSDLIDREAMAQIRLANSLRQAGRLDDQAFIRRVATLLGADGDVEQNEVLSGGNGDWNRISEPSWLIPGLLPAEAAIGLLYGPSGSFKTYLALDLGLALSQGQVFLPSSPHAKGNSPGFQGGPAPVLYIAAEDAASRLKRRLFELAGFRELSGWPGLDVRPADTLSGRKPLLLSDAKHRRQLMGMIAAEGYTVVVLDTLAESVRGLDEVRGRDASQLVDWAREINEVKATVLVVCHPRKGPAGTSRPPDMTDPENIRGHTALFNAADFSIGVICLKQKNETRELRFRMTKSRMLERYPDLVVEVCSMRDSESQAKFLYLRDFLGTSEEKKREREEMIEAAVEAACALASDGEPAPVAEIADRMGVVGVRVRSWLLEACRRSLLRPVGRRVGNREVTCYGPPD